MGIRQAGGFAASAFVIGWGLTAPAKSIDELRDEAGADVEQVR